MHFTRDNTRNMRVLCCCYAECLQLPLNIFQLTEEGFDPTHPMVHQGKNTKTRLLLSIRIAHYAYQ
jgi:hypothetical protein